MTAVLDTPARALTAAASDYGAAVALRDLTLSAADDPAAMAEFVRRTSPGVWRLCAALLDAPSADDMTQDTYVRAVRSLPSYRGEASPTSWLGTIARRVCAEEISRRQRARSLHDTLARETRAETAEDTGVIEILDALARLPRRRREALVLTGVAGLSYAEAATVCACPVGTIRSRVNRARTELMRALLVDRAPASAVTVAGAR